MTCLDLDEINPHLALWRSETYVNQGEKAWEAWVKKVERLLGHSLDGNQKTDGYSLDFAYEAFLEGDTPADHVVEVRAQKEALFTAFVVRTGA